MTKIDFYIAPEASSADAAAESHHLVACRIVEKAVRRDMSVYLHVENEHEAVLMDKLLWDFRPNAFIPHERLSQAKQESVEKNVVLIGHDEPGSHQPDLLINLSTRLPTFFARYLRLAEIVSQAQTAKIKSRERWKHYQERGYPLSVHNL